MVIRKSMCGSLIMKWVLMMAHTKAASKSLCLILGNAMHAVRTQCEVLDVSKYSNPSFGPFSQVFGSVPGFFFSFLSI